jgi:deoxyribodipyrimidine photo-lyase
MHEHVLVWFRQDLRIEDNPALAAALKTGRPLIPVYIYAPDEEAQWSAGGASRWWLHHALDALDGELQKYGSGLVLRKGATLKNLQDICKSHEVSGVFWNRRYEPAIIDHDAHIKQQLRAEGIGAESFSASLLYEPHTIQNRSGKPFRVFTPFWKHLRSLAVEAPVPVDTNKLTVPLTAPRSEPLQSLGLLPEIPWDKSFYQYWDPGLKAAGETLNEFALQRARRYKDHRDLPAVDGTSRLSPYLHFGQLGPRQVWQALLQTGSVDGPGEYTFLSEIGWREFAYHLLFHFPDTPQQALNKNYSQFPWQADDGYLKAWQTGQTGYPIVDAGMRQLWQTGWMHNRVRMITASFLVKHLLQPWQEGARWFWATLVDADLASNTMGWQWTAGCGADASPYFRIFSPMLQGAKFDANGSYIHKWVPELKNIPAKFIHQPWEAPYGVLKQAGVKLGDNYPKPVIDHKAGRERALAALSENKHRMARINDER